MTTSLTTSREGRKSARRLPSTVLAMEAAGSRADRSPLCGRGAAGGLPAPPPCRSRPRHAYAVALLHTHVTFNTNPTPLELATTLRVEKSMRLLQFERKKDQYSLRKQKPPWSWRRGRAQGLSLHFFIRFLRCRSLRSSLRP